MRHHFRYVFAGVILTTMPVTGCATNDWTNHSTVSQNSTANAASANSTSVQNTAVSHATQPANSTVQRVTTEPGANSAAPMAIDAIPGAMLSTGWPLAGTTPTNVGTGMFQATYTASGPVIGGVHWTWPSSDTNPKDYVVVPTTIQGKPFLVWCHLAPEKPLGSSETGSAAYIPHQLEPTGPSQMWMTPWTVQGGVLSKGATLITNDIPPAFSASGQYVFPSNPKDSSPSSLAGSAWTGWFQWGNVAHPYSVPAAKPPVETTVAVPTGLYPAYNGVVLAVQTQVLQANQGGAVNLYDLDLANHRIVGLASLTNGGGLFNSMRVVSGMVFTGAAMESGHNGQINATAYVYDEVTGQRTQVESSVVLSQNNGFGDWSIRGSKIYDANGKLQADLQLPASVTDEPSAATFGVSGQ
ncbi:hypothetical protein [Alicyclobacillus fastidiosus]|uniref:Uncharacterized protein n=1 Tax=Alicyclobacillus fastidiosus TaxID=392011 RepID=A0ABV5ACE8_9BACL|nr:hypothetical protein [Alicyclobacillus fastidiosus]WEH11365.1 hypothetical protein PYS47_09205 [Alicyclobacillus fastidiosus]